jgi:hypothetical protein
VSGLIELLSRHLPGGTEEKHAHLRLANDDDTSLIQAPERSAAHVTGRKGHTGEVCGPR